MSVVTPSPSQEVPVNIRFCLEGMEESGSEGLDALIFAQKDQFFKDVDFVCISDNYWLGKNKPCVTYGLRGICYFFIEVREAPPPQHTPAPPCSSLTCLAAQAGGLGPRVRFPALARGWCWCVAWSSWGR